MASEMTEARLRDIEAEQHLSYADMDEVIAALRQAWQERDRLAEQARDISVRLSDAGVHAMPIPEGVGAVIGDLTRVLAERDAARADLAALTALPPLPEGWVQEGHEGVGISFRTHDCYIGPNWVMPPTGVVSVQSDGVRVSSTCIPLADLRAVLRHAEREQARLSQGQR